MFLSWFRILLKLPDKNILRSSVVSPKGMEVACFFPRFLFRPRQSTRAANASGAASASPAFPLGTTTGTEACDLARSTFIQGLLPRRKPCTLLTPLPCEEMARSTEQLSEKRGLWMPQEPQARGGGSVDDPNWFGAIIICAHNHSLIQESHQIHE